MTGQELNKLLQRNGITQTALAKALGKTQQNIQFIFRAKSVKTSRLEQIAAALGKDMSFFLAPDAAQAADLQEQIKAKDETIRLLNERIDRLVEIIRKQRKA